MAEKPTKGTIVSFGNTPQARDDNFVGLGTEDSGILYLGVMANDLAGNGKSLWATDDGVSEGGDRPVDLLTQDAVNAAGASALGAKIWITADGRVAYQATPAMVDAFQSLSVGQSVTDSFTYAIQMGNGTLSWAKVNVTLAGTNDRPVVQNVSIAAVEDGQPVTGNFIGNDIDSDDDANSLTYNIIAQPAIGTLTKSGTTFTYAPGGNFQGLAQGETQSLGFTYTATDKHGAVSDPASGAITITGANDAPSLEAGASELTEDGAVVTVNLASLGADVDSDDDGGTLVYSTLDTPPGGSATINGTTLSLSPGSDFQSLAVGETTSFTVKVQAKDKHGATATNDISVKVTGVNDAPTLNAGALGAKEDGDAVMLDLASLGDDVDSDDDAGSLVYTLVGPAPQHGVATLSGSMLSYAPGQAFQGLAQGETTAFTLDVKATDKHGASTVNTVTVTVTGENDDPTLAAGKLTAFENGGAVTLDLSTLGDDVDSDDDGSTLTYAAPFPGPNGSTVNVSGTTLTFVPGTAFEQLPEMVPADFSVGIEATDRHGDKAFSHVAVRLIGKNDAPTLQAGVSAAQEDGGPVMLNLATLGDDIDNDDGPGSLLYALAAPVPAGQGAVQITGTSLTFTPGTDFQGLALDQKADVVLQLQATDKHGATAVNTVTVTVTGKNDAPTLKSGTLALTEDAGPATLSLAPLGDDIDSDNDGSNLVYTTGAGLPQGTATVNAATLSVDPGNGYQYLAAGETKTFDLALKATDAHGLFQNNVVTVSVTGMNDAPTLGGDTAGGVTAMAGNQTLTLEQWTGYPGPYAEASLRSHASANKANYTVSTTVVDFTDDPGGFAGEIPGSTPWPAAAATGTSGTGGINDQFFARVTGQISVPVTDTYTFRTFNDDGVYLRVNNQLIISDNSHHPEAAFTGSITLAPGVYPVELFFFEGGGEASLEFTVKNSAGSYGHVVSTQQLGDSGVLNFNDIDLIDTHTVTVAPVGTTLGAMSATMTQDSTHGGPGSVNWNYAVDNKAVVSLGAGQTRVETFTVTVSDNHGSSASQDVAVTITGINDAPQAVNDVLSVAEEQAVSINVLGNDSDPDAGDVLQLVGAGGASHGSLALSGNNVVYTSHKDYNGPDVFTYTVRDAAGITSTATVNVNVTGVTDTYALQNLAKNGSFEASTQNVYVSVGSLQGYWTVPNDWTMTGNGVDVVPGWQDADGNVSLDLNAFELGGVKQAIPTVAGQQYSVSFMLSKNPGGGGESFNDTVLVQAGASSAQYDFNLPNTNNSMMWQQKTFSFTGTGSSTELSFASLTPAAFGNGDIRQGPALDEVVVVTNQVINGFVKGGPGGDVLNLGSLLGSIGAPHDASAFGGGFLAFQHSGGNTLVGIDPNGGGDNYLTVATLVGVILLPTDTGSFIL